MSIISQRNCWKKCCKMAWGCVAREPPFPFWSGFGQSDTKAMPLVLQSHDELKDDYSCFYYCILTSLPGTHSRSQGGCSCKWEWQLLHCIQNHSPFRPWGSRNIGLVPLAWKMSTLLGITIVSPSKLHLVYSLCLPNIEWLVWTQYNISTLHI